MHSVHLGYCAPHLTLLFKLNSFFSLALSSPVIHNGREKKLINDYMWIKQFFKKVINLFYFQRHLKHFLENYRFCQKFGNDAYSREGVMLLALLRRIAYENRYANHSWCEYRYRSTHFSHYNNECIMILLPSREFCDFLTSLLIHKQIIT